VPKSKDDIHIFDRSFKQIINSLSSKALVHFINSLFGAKHPLDSDVKRLSTEQIDENLNKLQPDAVISVEKSVYIIEKQTTDDANGYRSI
jgi:hypothetical protein